MKGSAGLAGVVALMVFGMVNTQETTTTPCPRVECAPECFYENRTNGCPSCKCPKTCKDANCTVDEQCVLEQIVCIWAPCFPIPTCVPKNETTTPAIVEHSCAHEVLCMVGCKREVRPERCPTCVCPENCEAMNCSDGYECEMVTTSCFAAPCNASSPICVPIKTTTPCPVYKCGPGCFPRIGPNGCRICACHPTCEGFKCAEDEECVLEPFICIRTVCFPRPICVPRNDSCRGTPNTYNCDDSTYRWSYNASTDTCERFLYNGCTPSSNTFLSLQACEDKCNASNTCCYCGDSCYTFVRKNQRTRCLCPNPCQDFNCTGYDICKLREVECIKEPCYPIPYCAQNSCPKEPACGKRCMYGLKTDENGCQLCECCEEPKQT